MEEKYQELMDAVLHAAKSIQLPPEDLAIYILEGTHINCPPIYEAVRSHAGVDSFEE